MGEPSDASSILTYHSSRPFTRGRPPKPLLYVPLQDVSRELRERALATGKPAELSLLLQCARVEARPPAVLPPDLDWAYLVDMAHRHGVVALVYLALRARGFKGVPAPVVRGLQRDFHALGIRVHFLVDELLRLLALFEEAGIEAIPFKGPALGAFAYGDPVRRKPGDLDVLVRKRDFFRARDILRAQNYEPRVPPGRDAAYLARHHTITFENSQCSVDLHWTLVDQPFDSFPGSSSLQPALVWKRCTSVTLKGTPVRMLGAEDLLSYLCSHGAKHSWTGLFMLSDLDALIRCAPEPDWDEMLAAAARTHTERIFFLGLLLAHALLDAPLPEPVAARILDDPAVRKLALQVGTWFFDPNSKVRERFHEFSDSLQHHRFRVQMLQRPVDKVRYLWYRQRKKMARKRR